jgi:ABC-type Fe3+ transport system substrate-binding protein
MNIEPEITIGELLDLYPEVLPVFAAHGFRADSPESLRQQLDPSWMLQTVLAVKQLNPVLFIERLNEAIAEAAEARPLLATEHPHEGHLELLAYIVCPLKHLFKEGLERELRVHREQTGKAINAFMLMGCGGQDPCEDIWKVDAIDDFPDLVVSMGFDNLFKRNFLERFVASGYFQAVQPGPVAEAFAGIPDPRGRHTIYAVFPYVLLIDRAKLGTRPLPRRWGDLLNPAYRGQIVIAGAADDISEILLLHFDREFGPAGLEQLAANVKDAWHASKMVKTAGSGRPEGVAIYILPWFFAESSAHKDAVAIVWPEDGALVNPMYMLVKASKRNEMAPFSGYVTGKEFGEKAARAFFPALNPAVDNRLPPGARFKWLGWDYIWSVDLEERIESARAAFLKAWQPEAR